MRLDLFLKNIHIAKRRNEAKRETQAGDILLNGRTAKPASKVKVGDELSVAFATAKITFKVLGVPERPIKKGTQNEYIQVLSKDGVELF
jgi:ribosomal 50S subunit-recycling heat shock protein